MFKLDEDSIFLAGADRNFEAEGSFRRTWLKMSFFHASNPRESIVCSVSMSVQYVLLGHVEHDEPARHAYVRGRG